MIVTIDAKPMEVNPDDKNILDAADRTSIGIPAPCYRVDRSKGCCNGCVIEVNG